jgi:hypothetical protein
MRVWAGFTGSRAFFPSGRGRLGRKGATHRLQRVPSFGQRFLAVYLPAILLIGALSALRAPLWAVEVVGVGYVLTASISTAVQRSRRAKRSGVTHSFTQADLARLRRVLLISGFLSMAVCLVEIVRGNLPWWASVVLAGWIVYSVVWFRWLSMHLPSERSD